MLPLGIVLITLGASTGMSLNGLLWLQIEWTQIQLDLDHCMGRRTQLLQKTLEHIERTNLLISALRAGKVISTLLRIGLPQALKITLKAVVLYQIFLLKRWKREQLLWQRGRLCLSKRDWWKMLLLYQAEPLPTLYFKRPLPDPLGSRPLIWKSKDPQPNDYHLQVRLGNRACAGKVRRENESFIPTWKLTWAPPLKNPSKEKEKESRIMIETDESDEELNFIENETEEIAF